MNISTPFRASHGERRLRRRVPTLIAFVASIVSALMAAAQPAAAQPAAERAWRPGDHHVHSRNSLGYNRQTDPPTPIAGSDANYSILLNALKAKEYGLDWMVSTDHGGPGHSAFNLEKAYPELRQARALVSGLLLFYGMEFDAPGANHTSLIIPRAAGEDSMLFEIERHFGERETDAPERLTDALMTKALQYMRQLPEPPLLFVNHPSRADSVRSGYTNNPPAQMRSWNDTAPQVAVGMEGAPGHQALFHPDGTLNAEGRRGIYRRFPTMGGFDKMTATLGGVWDALLGEGRHWWITATSDLHSHWSRGGNDFWPGEYAKTYVYAEDSYDAVLEGLREGRIFAVTGDLVSELYVTATPASGRSASCSVGETLTVSAGTDVDVTIRLRDPNEPNAYGLNPRVQRVDLIMGEVTGPASASKDTNATTRVVKRFSKDDWTREEPYLTMTYRLQDVSGPHYVRVRGTNTSDTEPERDTPGENPWEDLWFYSNPVFLEIR